MIPNEFYSGCWAIASVNAYAYDNAGNRGAAFGLLNLQKIKDDKPFGIHSKPEEDFKPIGNSSSTDDLMDDDDDDFEL